MDQHFLKTMEMNKLHLHDDWQSVRPACPQVLCVFYHRSVKSDQHQTVIDRLVERHISEVEIVLRSANFDALVIIQELHDSSNNLVITRFSANCEIAKVQFPGLTNRFVERFNKLTWMRSVDLTDLVPRLSALFDLLQAGAVHNDHGDTLDVVHPSRLLCTVSTEIGLTKCASGVLLHFTSAVSLDQ
ncbi:hypothetical protein T4E_5508 [Trichinella pseudospiralis]|uniref:Uncharacterized protein n=1 Tax=Trichinella pseudospiralis TaxID=6337 RepID=A0A0V0XM85_TRIPS|nr:hypothetical protein T4E_5508 [Trichinella pseudospiralis]